MLSTVESKPAKPAKQYTYSEIFNSIQGEGMYTGVHTLWLRFFLCNLQCDGFGQIEPTKPDSWELPYQDFDVSKIEKVEDLPVWDKGCDSSYTWSKKYKHLMAKKPAKEILQDIVNISKTKTNPEGGFYHPGSKQRADLCFTGGEPLMKLSQMAVMELNEEMRSLPNLVVNRPRCITWETNGTQVLTEDFKTMLLNRGMWQHPVFFSVSPKLWTVAGEKREKAIKPDIVKEYDTMALNCNAQSHMAHGQLKFVMGPRKEQWEELEEVIALFREAGIKWPIYIMPVGATVEEQETSAGEVAKMAYERGYHVSGRLHCYLFGNAIGT